MSGRMPVVTPVHERPNLSNTYMTSLSLTNRINATIDCPLKKSTIVWSKCENYRTEFGCLCKEARDRLKIKCTGIDALQAQLQRIKRPVPEAPIGWLVEKKTRFYLIQDTTGETVHRATNMKEAKDYLQICAKVQFLQEENEALWAVLRDELIETIDPVEADEADAAEDASKPAKLF